jgi:hypothetical protein
MDMHNVFRECPYENREYMRNTNARVESFMRPLIDELARKRPTWTFVSTNHSTNSDGDIYYYYTKFSVRVGDEEIGWIDKDRSWRDGSQYYEYDCRALRKARERGHCNRTKDLKKAAKVITGSFCELSYGEHMVATQSAIRSTAHRIMSGRKYDYGQSETKARSSIMAFLRANWDAFLTTVSDPELAMLLDKYDTARDAEAVATNIAKHGAYVKLMDGKYVVNRVGGDDVHVYTSDNLPDDLRGPIGALKMVNDNTLIPEIGVRSEDGILYVIPTVKHDE